MTASEQAVQNAPVRIEEIPLGSPRISEFVRFPWRLYRGDPFWTPPLNADLLGSRILGVKGLLTRQNEYHETADVTHFLAWRGEEPVGTVSAAINHRFNDYYRVKLGFFGFFECVDDQAVANALLDAAQAWIRARGMGAMRGPGQYSNATHERQGVLVDGFDTPPTVELTHNPPYYDRLLKAWGLDKVKDYFAYAFDILEEPERLQRMAKIVRQRTKLETRGVDMRRLEEEVRLVVEIYNDAWSDNWGFLPITKAEADALAEALKPIIDPELVRFAYVDGKPAAVLGGIPDPYVALRPRWRWYGDSDPVRLARLLLMRRKIPRMRLMFFGIRPPFRKLGLEAVLFDEGWRYSNSVHYRWCENSMLLENNELILRISDLVGASRYKTWRIYERAL